jgi:hypothetical protein
MTIISVENNVVSHTTLATPNKPMGDSNLGIKLGTLLDTPPKVNTPMGLRMVFININDYGSHILALSFTMLRI